MEDKELVGLFFARDEAAIIAAQNKYGAYCRSIAAQILKSRESAEECLNDALLRAWQAIPPQKPEDLKAFIGRITRNLSLSRLRDANRIKRGGGEVFAAIDELENCVCSDKTPETELEERELTASINRWLEALPKEKRIAFMRRYWYFDSIAAIAVRMDWSAAKTNSVLRRLRGNLKNHLESEDNIV